MQKQILQARGVAVAICLITASLNLLASDNPTAPPTARQVTLGKETSPTVYLWLSTSLTRIFPNTPPGNTELHLLAPRNGRISFQACVRNDRIWPLRIDGAISGAEKLKPQVRRVGLVPMWHFTPATDPSERDGANSLPGLVPDPLYPVTGALIGPKESRSYWITLRIPADAKPGTRELKFRFILGDSKEVTELPVTLEISTFVIQPRRDFHVIHWTRGEANWDYYKTDMFDDRWWEITRAQLENMLDHGSDVAYVPIFFDRREVFRRPCQLLIVDEPEPGKYRFDWSRAKRYTDISKRAGFTHFEWSHLWLYWGVENPVHVYKKQDDKYVMLWPPTRKPHRRLT